jgi:hypothetical protein
MRWRIRSILLRIAAVIVAALHARLLWQRIDDLSITDPEVIVRWSAAAIAAAVGLLLLHFRASWRSWLVFWIVIVLLHVAAPVDARLDVLVETVFALAPWFLVVGGITSARMPANATRIDDDRLAFPIPLLVSSLPCRAPPCS